MSLEPWQNVTVDPRIFHKPLPGPGPIAQFDAHRLKEAQRPGFSQPIAGPAVQGQGLHRPGVRPGIVSQTQVKIAEHVARPGLVAPVARLPADAQRPLVAGFGPAPMA